MTVLQRLLPKEADNRFDGHRAALWLLGLFVFMKFAMSLNIIFNTEKVAVGADGFHLDHYGPDGARAVLMLFARLSLSQLAIALVALIVLIRYRALVPLICLLLIVEHLVGRWIVQSYAVPRSDTGGVGWYVSAAVLMLLGLGLVLSLLPRKESKT